MDLMMRDCLMHISPFIREDEVEEAVMISDFDILFKFKNGDKIIYDSFEHTYRHLRYGDELTDEQHQKEFGMILQKKMDRKLINQYELAEQVGTTQQMISRYITGKSTPSYTMIFKLAKALGCSVDDLYYKNF